MSNETLINDTNENIKPLSYEKYLKMMKEKDSPEQQWLYGEYLERYRQACPK